MEYAPIIDLEELGGQSTTDSEGALKLHLLCPKCIQVSHGISNGLQIHEKDWKGTCKSTRLKPSHWRHDIPIPRTIKSIQESAERGCHLCSLFYADSERASELDPLSGQTRRRSTDYRRLGSSDQLYYILDHFIATNGGTLMNLQLWDYKSSLFSELKVFIAVPTGMGDNIPVVFWSAKYSKLRRQRA